MYENDYDFKSRHARQPKGKAIRAECPSCFNSVNVGSSPRIGQFVVCASCKTELEVVWLSPIELDIPFGDSNYEDDDDDDDF